MFIFHFLRTNPLIRNNRVSVSAPNLLKVIFSKNAFSRLNKDPYFFQNFPSFKLICELVHYTIECHYKPPMGHKKK